MKVMIRELFGQPRVQARRQGKGRGRTSTASDEDTFPLSMGNELDRREGPGCREERVGSVGRVGLSFAKKSQREGEGVVSGLNSEREGQRRRRADHVELSEVSEGDDRLEAESVVANGDDLLALYACESRGRWVRKEGGSKGVSAGAIRQRRNTHRKSRDECERKGCGTYVLSEDGCVYGGGRHFSGCMRSVEVLEWTAGRTSDHLAQSYP